MYDGDARKIGGLEKKARYHTHAQQLSLLLLFYYDHFLQQKSKIKKDDF